jgi:hypothetical protein
MNQPASPINWIRLACLSPLEVCHERWDDQIAVL